MNFDIINKVKETIDKYSLISDGDKLVLAVSGGSDSMALLHIMKYLRDNKVYNFDFLVVSCDHNTRSGESKRDLEFVKSVCADSNIECITYDLDIEKGKIDLKMSSDEEVARHLRYDSFFDACNKSNANKIATAHNSSDNTETVLLNLIRGTGINGLCGIPKKKGKIIRPLIEISKEDIRTYCKENNIEYKEDYTNSEDEYTRNKLRLNTIPYIKENINDKLDDTILTMTNNLSLDRAYMEEQMILAYNKCASMIIESNGNNDNTNTIKIDLNEFNKNHLAIKKRVLKNAITLINDGSSKDLTNVHIDLVLDILNKGTGKQITILNNITARISYDNLFIYKDNNVSKIRDLVVVKSSFELAINNKEDNNSNDDSYVITEALINDKKVSLRTLDSNSSNVILDMLKNDKESFVSKMKEESKEKLYLDLDMVKKKTNVISSDNNELSNVNTNVYFRFKMREDGDKILLDGISYKKLKDIFIDEKIDKEERDNYIVFEKVEEVIETKEIINTDIIAILGLRISPKYMITENTKEILELSFNI